MDRKIRSIYIWMLSKEQPFASEKLWRQSYAQDLVNVFETQAEKRKIAKERMKRGVFSRDEQVS
jgi:hypothetical protein